MNHIQQNLSDVIEPKHEQMFRSMLCNMVTVGSPESVTAAAIEFSVFDGLGFRVCVSKALMAHGNRGVPCWKDLGIRLIDAFLGGTEASRKELEFLIGLVIVTAGTQGILRPVIQSYLNAPRD